MDVDAQKGMVKWNNELMISNKKHGRQAIQSLIGEQVIPEHSIS